MSRSIWRTGGWRFGRGSSLGRGAQRWFWPTCSMSVLSLSHIAVTKSCRTAHPAIPPATPDLTMYSQLRFSNFFCPPRFGTMASSSVGHIFGSRFRLFWWAFVIGAIWTEVISVVESWVAEKLFGFGVSASCRVSMGFDMPQRSGVNAGYWVTKLSFGSTGEGASN
jgi:hypothetical protein